MRPTVIVHIDEDGNPQYLSSPGVDVYVVDERTPNDRVFRMSEGTLQEQSEIEAILGDAQVGHAGDQRHEALSMRVRAAASGEPHLTSIEPTRH